MLRGPFVSIVICYRDGGFKLYDGSCCEGGVGGVFVLLFGFSVGMSTINLLMVSHLLFVDNT